MSGVKLYGNGVLFYAHEIVEFAPEIAKRDHLALQTQNGVVVGCRDHRFKLFGASEIEPIEQGSQDYRVFLRRAYEMKRAIWGVLFH